MAVPQLLDRPTRPSPSSTASRPAPAAAPPRRPRTPGRAKPLLVGAVAAAALATVPGSQPRTTEFTPLDCTHSATRDEHWFPHEYVGEVFLQVGTNSPVGAHAHFVIAWGSNRWPPTRTRTIPPARTGGVMFMFVKLDGADQPLYSVVFSSSESLCFRWGTTSTIPGVNGVPAYGWVEGHDRV
jgi:hypothetical protein